MLAARKRREVEQQEAAARALLGWVAGAAEQRRYRTLLCRAVQLRIRGCMSAVLGAWHARAAGQQHTARMVASFATRCEC